MYGQFCKHALRLCVLLSYFSFVAWVNAVGVVGRITNAGNAPMYNFSMDHKVAAAPLGPGEWSTPLLFGTVMSGQTKLSTNSTPIAAFNPANNWPVTFSVRYRYQECQGATTWVTNEFYTWVLTQARVAGEGEPFERYETSVGNFAVCGADCFGAQLTVTNRDVVARSAGFLRYGLPVRTFTVPACGVATLTYQVGSEAEKTGVTLGMLLGASWLAQGEVGWDECPDYGFNAMLFGGACSSTSTNATGNAGGDEITPPSGEVGSLTNETGDFAGLTNYALESTQVWAAQTAHRDMASMASGLGGKLDILHEDLYSLNSPAGNFMGSQSQISNLLVQANGFHGANSNRLNSAMNSLLGASNLLVTINSNGIFMSSRLSFISNSLETGLLYQRELTNYGAQHSAYLGQLSGSLSNVTEALNQVVTNTEAFVVTNAVTISNYFTLTNQDLITNQVAVNVTITNLPDTNEITESDVEFITASAEAALASSKQAWETSAVSWKSGADVAAGYTFEDPGLNTTISWSGVTVDWNPLNNDDFAGLVPWVRAVAKWGMIAAYILWALTVVFDVVREFKPQGGTPSTVMAWTIRLALIVIFCGFVNLGSEQLLDWVLQRFGTYTDLAGNPLSGANVHISFAMYMLDQFFPVALGLSLILNAIWFRTVVISVLIGSFAKRYAGI